MTDKPVGQGDSHGGHEIPLDEVAPDTRDFLDELRQRPAAPFDSVPVAEARANYERTASANAMAPRALPHVCDHRIAVGDGARIVVREYRPSSGAAPLPAVLFLHGGGWVIGSPDTHDAICRLLAAESGAAVFSVGYRLAPEHPFPIPLHDCAAALRWLGQEAGFLAIDPARIAVAGDSAGGNLAAVLANTAALHAPGTGLRAQVLFYPVVDLSRETAGYDRIASGFTLTGGAMRIFRRLYLTAESAPADPLVSPLLAPRLSDAPLFLLTCGYDPLCEEGLAYATAAARAGIRLEHHHLPRHGHGILSSAGRIASGEILARRAAAFLRDALAGP